MNNIYVFNNFISPEDSLALIDHIELNIDTFNTGVLKLYHQQMFGHNPLSKTSNKISDYPVVASIANSAFSKAINISKKTFNDDKILYPSSFWLARQLPEAVVKLHGDDDGGATTYFKYSCSVYLNNTNKTGPINFPNLKYKYWPKAGDMILWPSQGREYDHEVSVINDYRYTMVMWLTDQKEFSMEADFE
jgi:hypothetical protein